MEPAVLVYRLSGGFGHLVVALHYVVAARAEFAYLTRGQSLARVRVNYLALDSRERLADRCAARLEGILRRCHRAAGRRLGLTENDNNIMHVHLLANVVHRLYRAGRACHDARAHMREIIFVEVRVLEHGNEHRRHAVDCGAVLCHKRIHDLFGVEHINRHKGRSVGYAGHEREHHAEAVEERNRDAQPVVVGELHAVAYRLAVIENVVVGEHNALGESRRAGGVLNIDDLVAVARVAYRLKLLDGGFLGESIELLPVDHARRALALTRVDNAL